MRRFARTAAAFMDRTICGCDTSDRVVFDAVGKILPRNAVWYASNLKRTHQTAQAIWDAGFPKPSDMPHDQCVRRAASRPMAGHESCGVLRKPAARQNWLTGIDEPAPGGESFMDLYRRVCGGDRTDQRRAGGQGRHRGRAWRHDQGRHRACARRPAGQGPRFRYRQLLGDAARSSRKRRLHRLAAADGQPAALDRRSRRTPRCISPPARK